MVRFQGSTSMVNAGLMRSAKESPSRTRKYAGDTAGVRPAAISGIGSKNQKGRGVAVSDCGIVEEHRDRSEIVRDGSTRPRDQ